jgi:hypothetical protein
VTGLDAFGRSCIAWPAAIIGAVLTEIAGAFLRFAAWMMDYEDENGDLTE